MVNARNINTLDDDVLYKNRVRNLKCRRVAHFADSAIMVSRGAAGKTVRAVVFMPGNAGIAANTGRYRRKHQQN